MAKYLLLKHYHRTTGPDWLPGTDVPMDQWEPDEITAHVAFMSQWAEEMSERGEFVDGQALEPTGAFVRYDGEGKPPVTDGPFPETKELIAGWMIIDVDSQEAAYEAAARLSAAPGKGGKPIHEWIEVRPFYGEPPVVTE